MIELMVPHETRIEEQYTFKSENYNDLVKLLKGRSKDYSDSCIKVRARRSAAAFHLITYISNLAQRDKQEQELLCRLAFRKS